MDHLRSKDYPSKFRLYWIFNGNKIRFVKSGRLYKSGISPPSFLFLHSLSDLNSRVFQDVLFLWVFLIRYVRFSAEPKGP